MKRILVKDLAIADHAEKIEKCLSEKRISFQISKEEGWVQVDACGPCSERLKKEGKPIEGCEKCVGMTLEIIKDLGYCGELMR